MARLDLLIWLKFPTNAAFSVAKSPLLTEKSALVGNLIGGEALPRDRQDDLADIVT